MDKKPEEFDARLIESEGSKVEVVTYQPKNVETVEKKGWKKYGGFIFTAISSIFFSLTILMVKLLGKYHPLTVSVWRFLGILIPPIPLAFYYQCKDDKPDNIFKAVWPLKGRENIVRFLGVHARGFVTVIMVLLRFWALQYLNVADLSVISYTGPVFVMFLAYFLLDEKCGTIPILVAVTTCFGVIVIIRPPVFTGTESFDSNTLIGVAFGLGSTLCNAVVVILVRRIRKVHFVYTLLVGGIWGVGECAIIAAALGVLNLPEGKWDTIIAFGLLPVFAFLANFLIIIALKFESAGPVSLMRACDVICSFIWQIIFLGVYPDLYSYAGAAIVVICVAILTVRKWLSTLPLDHESRIKFGVLLK